VRRAPVFLQSKIKRMRCFCTYFDHRYLSRGIALYRSLEKYCPDFCLWVLGLSRECCAVLAQCAFDRMKIIPLESIEAFDKGLGAVKAERNLVEYYFTLTPSLPLYVFNEDKNVDFLTYIDADCCFFSDPTPLFEEIGGKSVAIIGHRFSPHLAHLEKYGKYNVSWLSFRRNKQGLACLSWYHDKCQEWCHDYLDGDRYADQKYLDQFEKLFPEVHVLTHKGANLAPWNAGNYALVLQNGKIFVDKQLLIFYHFERLKKLFGPVFDTGFHLYHTKLTPFIKEHVYRGYVAELQEIQKRYLSRTPIPPVLLRMDNKSKILFIKRLNYDMYEALKRVSNLFKAVKANSQIIAR
jgi:hypothetical protein